MIEHREVPHESPIYREAVELRRRVLRFPLGLDFTPEQLAAERTDIHLVSLETGVVLATTLLTRRSAAQWQLRQFAVEPSRQGEGIGRALLGFAEEVARGSGVSQIMLHARQVAVGFYERCGYAVEGEPFEEVGIPHRRMSKSLTPVSPLPVLPE